MAITNNLELSDYHEIQLIIEEILLKRKYKFNIDDMIIQIRKEILNRGFDSRYVDCSLFYVLVLNIIDNLSSDNLNPKLYKIEDNCIPVDYIILKNYSIGVNDKFLYYVKKKNVDGCCKGDYYFIDIDTGETVNSAKRNDIVLCGGVSDDRYKTTLQSNISYEEIKSLFNDFLREGASKTEAINHILNYYKAYGLPNDYSWGKDFVILNKKVLVFCPRKLGEISKKIDLSNLNLTIGPCIKKQRIRTIKKDSYPRK